MEIRTYTVKVLPAAEGGYWAYVPALPGCFTQGETLEEVKRMAQEAVEGFIQVLAERGNAIDFHVQVLGLSFHDAMRQITGS